MTVANAKPDAECPDGKDEERGIAVWRPRITPAESRSGRVRSVSCLRPTFTTADDTRDRGQSGNGRPPTASTAEACQHARGCYPDERAIRRVREMSKGHVDRRGRGGGDGLVDGVVHCREVVQCPSSKRSASDARSASSKSRSSIGGGELWAVMASIFVGFQPARRRVRSPRGARRRSTDKTSAGGLARGTVVSASLAITTDVGWLSGRCRLSSRPARIMK